MVHVWVVMLFAGVFLAVFNFWASKWWRKTIATVSILSFIVAAAAGINIDFGDYRNLNDALGISPFSALLAARLSAHAGAMDVSLGKTWKAREHTVMPKHGTVGMVRIPATQSHFGARQAVVHLPPQRSWQTHPFCPF